MNNQYKKVTIQYEVIAEATTLVADDLVFHVPLLNERFAARDAYVKVEAGVRAYSWRLG